MHLPDYICYTVDYIIECMECVEMNMHNMYNMPLSIHTCMYDIFIDIYVYFFSQL